MNAREVLANVENMIEEGKAYKYQWNCSKKWRISEVCEELGIFDWWNDYLSMSQLKQMKKFLEVAISHGFTGYVCFKVGAKYCANGMWAHKAESTTGYSPDGEAIYHSFVNGSNYYDYCNAEGKWLANDDKYEFTLKEIEQAMIG